MNEWMSKWMNERKDEINFLHESIIFSMAKQNNSDYINGFWCLPRGSMSENKRKNENGCIWKIWKCMSVFLKSSKSTSNIHNFKPVELESPACAQIWFLSKGSSSIILPLVIRQEGWKWSVSIRFSSTYFKNLEYLFSMLRFTLPVHTTIFIHTLLNSLALPFKEIFTSHSSTIIFYGYGSLEPAAPFLLSPRLFFNQIFSKLFFFKQNSKKKN